MIKTKLRKLVCLPVCGAILTAGILSGCGAAEYTAAKLLKADSYDVSDYVTLCDISDIDISEIEQTEVTDESIEAAVNSMLEFFPDYKKADKEIVEDGDTVDIDYTGVIDGEEIDTESDTGSYLTIGNNTMADGFDAELIGHKVGDEFTIALTLPGNYENATYTNKDITYTVKINGIYDRVVYTCDNVTDEFISECFDYDTLDAYEKYMADFLEASNEESYGNETQMEILNQLVEKSEITIPDGLYDQIVAESVARIEDAADTEGMDVDEYLQYYCGYESLDDYKENQTDITEESIKQDLVVKKLMLDLKISFTQDEFDDFLEEYSEYYGCDSEEQLYEVFGSEENTLIACGEVKAMAELVAKVTA